MLVAAFIMSITGFGFVLITTPLLLFLVDPKTAIVYNVILGTLICIPVLWDSRKFFRPRKIAILCLSNIIGIPLGIYALSQLSSPVLRLVVIVTTVIFAGLLAGGVTIKIGRENLGCGVIGFFSGILSTSTGIGGLPVILFLLNQGWPKDIFRANLTAYFIFSGAVAAVALGFSGVVTVKLFFNALMALPAMAVGYYLGALLLPRINALVFRKISIYVLMGTGLLGILDAVVTMH